MAYDIRLADRIRRAFQQKGVAHEAKAMMGGLCFMVNGKMCVGVADRRLMARIDPDRYADALTKPGCKPMDFTGRPMRGFVFIEPDGIRTARQLASWLELALAFNPKAKSSKAKSPAVHPDTAKYNGAQAANERSICDLLAREISRNLPEAENKIWHAHPVWFLDGNPIVGYSKLKNCIRLLFWSGQSFDEDGLTKEGSFKAAEVRYTTADEVNVPMLKRWLTKAGKIQWDYKNLVRCKGRLERKKILG